MALLDEQEMHLYARQRLPEVDRQVEEVVLRPHPAWRNALVFDEAVLIEDVHHPLPPASIN